MLHIDSVPIVSFICIHNLIVFFRNHWNKESQGSGAPYLVTMIDVKKRQTGKNWREHVMKWDREECDVGCEKEAIVFVRRDWTRREGTRRDHWTEPCAVHFVRLCDFGESILCICFDIWSISPVTNKPIRTCVLCKLSPTLKYKHWWRSLDIEPSWINVLDSL